MGKSKRPSPLKAVEMNGNRFSAVPVILRWEEFMREEPGGDLGRFAGWLARRESGIVQESSRPGKPAAVAKTGEVQTGRSSSYLSEPSRPGGRELDEVAKSTLLITRIERIMDVLSKPILQRIGFAKGLEFFAIVQLAIMNRPNKKELCQEMLIEISTGVELTKRLAKRGYLLEEEDEQDRRSSRLSLTQKGRNAIKRGYEELALIHKDFLDCFTAAEKKELVALLTRLHDFQARKLDTGDQDGPQQ